MQVHQAIEQFLSHCRHTKKLSKHTLRAYNFDLTDFKKHATGNMPIEACDKCVIQSYYRYLFEERGLKESSVKRRIACLKAMFSWLEMELNLETNPFHKLKLRIKLPSRLPRALTRSELHALLNTPIKRLGINTRSDYGTNSINPSNLSRQEFIQLTTLISIELLFATGIRVGEMTQIRLTDLDIVEGNIKIQGKGNRERQVFLPDNPIRILIQTYITARTAFSPSTSALLITTRGTPLTTQVVRLLIRRTGEHAKLSRRITPHMLRHSTATHLLSTGVDIRYVQRLLGHQSIVTTQIYTHVSDSQLKSVICASHPIDDIARQ